MCPAPPGATSVILNSDHTKQRLSVREAAQYLGLSASTLNKLRVFGGGPTFLKLGRRVA